MAKQGKHFYEFGPFRIDKVERLLRRGEEAIPLAPKSVETLLVLLESGGEVVEKDELMKRVWPDTFVEEGGLARNISLLRKALGGGADDSQYIETIPRRGYRFVAPVKEVHEDLPSTVPAPPAPPPSTRKVTWAVPALVAALIIGVLAYFRPSPPPPTGDRSLAVLPLENLSNDPAEDYFADGMTDELINYLMRIEALRVSSRTSVMMYKGVSKPLRQIAAELKVGLVVEGTVLRERDRVRITAQVIDVATEKQLWAETYEKDIRDVLALQSEVASAIAREIRVKVTPQEKASLAKSRTVNPEAYQAYLRGRYFWNKRTPDQLKRATEHFRQAITQDPTYALAHTGLADGYALLGSIGYDAMPPREAMTVAKAAANSALQIDDTLAEAHTSLGYVKLSYDWDWPGAEQEFKRAIELNPVYATAHQWYAHYLMAMGRLDEAAREMKRALELDPLSIPINMGVGWSFYYARNYDQAIEQYRKTLEIVPNLPMVLYELGLVYQNKKLYEQALAEFQKADKFSGGEPAAVMLLGHAHALLGRKAEAYTQVARLQRISKQRYVPTLYTACIYAALDKDQAFVWFEKAYQERSDYLIYLKVEPSLDNLRSDPRYRDLLRKVGLER